MYVYLFPLFWYNIYRKEREVIDHDIHKHQHILNKRKWRALTIELYLKMIREDNETEIIILKGLGAGMKNTFSLNIDGRSQLEGLKGDLNKIH